jgi:DNA-binding domain
MPQKEDRSDWVAVPSMQRGGGNDPAVPVIKKATSAFQYFQKDVAIQLRPLKLDFVAYNRTVRERWEALSDGERLVYQQLAAADKDRYARESHQRDVQALERQEKLRREREQLVLLSENHEDKEYYDEDDPGAGRRRITRKGLHKKSDDESSYDSDDGSSDEDDNDDGDDEGREAKPKKKKKDKKKKAAKTKKPREMSEKQRELHEKRRAEKSEKEEYIAGRQQDLQKEKAAQAKRRLEFLLKQSAIFSHFGRVKEDTAKYGIKTAAPAASSSSSAASAGGVRRSASALGDDDDNKELEEADEHEATFLMSQPSTLSHGKMRDYQLEGLNWMIRLQENGVNGILADEMYATRPSRCSDVMFVSLLSVSKLLCFAQGPWKDLAVHLHSGVPAGVPRLHRAAPYRRPQVDAVQLDERVRTVGSHHQGRQVPRGQGDARGDRQERARAGPARRGPGLARVHHHLRDLQHRAVGVAEVLLDVLHPGRGAPPQERVLGPVQDGPELRNEQPDPHHGDAPPEFPSRALGAVELSRPGCL